MTKTKFIFDLDGTLIKTDYSAEQRYFESVFGKDNLLVKNIGSYLAEYEDTFERYDHETLCKFLSMKTGYSITPSFIDGWIDAFSKAPNPLMEGAEELLFELKKNNKDVVVLSNWYTKCQTDRLKATGLLKYVDEVYGGDVAFKPNSLAFDIACGHTPYEECLMIGDTYSKDYVGAEQAHIDCLLLDPKDEVKVKRKIKKLSEIKEWI